MPKRKKTDGPEDAAMPRFPARSPEFSMPERKTVGAQELVSTLKSAGRGWTDDMPGLLALPERTLVMMKTEDTAYYSKDLRFGIASILSKLDSGGPINASDNEYGIALYSTGGSVYFVLADIGRKIIVRERMFCIHEKPQEKDWKDVKLNMDSALVFAASAEKGTVIVSDAGSIRKAKLESG